MQGGEACRSKGLNDVEREKTEDLLVNCSNVDGGQPTGRNKIGPPRAQCFSPNTRRKCGIRPEFSYRDNITVRGRREGDESQRGRKNIMGNPSWCKIDDVTGEVYFALDGSCPITPPRSHAAVWYPRGASSSCSSRRNTPLSSPRASTSNGGAIDYNETTTPSGRRTSRGQAALSLPHRVTKKLYHSPARCADEFDVPFESI